MSVMSSGFGVSSFSFQGYGHLIKWLCKEPHLKALLCNSLDPLRTVFLNMWCKYVAGKHAVIHNCRSLGVL